MTEDRTRHVGVRRGLWLRTAAPALAYPGETEAWTAGRSLKARATVWGVWLLLLAWPIAAVSGYGMLAPREDVVVPAVEVSLDPVGQSAGAIAQGYVSAWLGASREDTENLERYTDAGSLRLPKTALPVRGLSLASVDGHGGAGTFTVTVGAEVRSGAATAWVQRFFEVTLTGTGEGFRTVGLPREVPVPLAGSTTLKGYSTALPGTDAVSDSVAGFLNAYLAGTGDLSRFVSPDKPLTALSPAPYEVVKLQSATADSEVPADPVDGERIHVDARAQLVSGTSVLTGDYQLTFTARAGRWEVSHLGLDTAMLTLQNDTTSAPRQ